MLEGFFLENVVGKTDKVIVEENDDIYNYLMKDEGCLRLFLYDEDIYKFAIKVNENNYIISPYSLVVDRRSNDYCYLN